MLGCQLELGGTQGGCSAGTRGHQSLLPRALGIALEEPGHFSVLVPCVSHREELPRGPSWVVMVSPAEKGLMLLICIFILRRSHVPISCPCSWISPLMLTPPPAPGPAWLTLAHPVSSLAPYSMAEMADLPESFPPGLCAIGLRSREEGCAWPGSV